MMRKVIIVAGLILFMVIGRAHGQEKEVYNTPLLGVKTNTLYWLTTTINIGAEIGLGKNTTIDLLGTYNPWSFGDNKKIKHCWYNRSFATGPANASMAISGDYTLFTASLTWAESRCLD